MKFLIPTAKEMKTDSQSYPQHLPLASQAIVNYMSSLSVEQLQICYKVRSSIADSEFQHWQSIKKEQSPAYAALVLFNGLMYRHIKREQLTSDETSFIKDNIFITSSLYSIIPAFEPIVPHRLDFNTKVKIGGKSLKNYWRNTYDVFVLENEPIISLLSSEFEDVFSPDVRKQLISLKFLERKNGQLKSHSTTSKKARGAFLTQAIKQQAQTIEDLRNIRFDGFSYQEELSTPLKWTFIKDND